jgi:hypothetical protein
MPILSPDGFAPRNFAATGSGMKSDRLKYKRDAMTNHTEKQLPARGYVSRNLFSQVEPTLACE